MTDDNKFSESKRENEVTKEQATEKVDLSKRRFAKSSLLAAPVVMTLANKPAWANKCTLSGQLSGNLSHQDEDEKCGGEGCSPGYWKTHLDSWHSMLPPEALFDTVFQTSAFPGRTLLEIVSVEDDDGIRGEPPAGCSFDYDNDGDHHNGGHHKGSNYHSMLRQLGFHSVAALQNAATTVSFDLTVEEVIASFQNAWESCNLELMEEAKNSLDFLNNQYCPLN
ncbi:MAG: hypothetical protein OEZ47_00160 [Gammaproteobacteria bacterium]|nr:hypothetical protein [Gammaproteobacteria bacterium]